jgi:hypothetical protein
MSPDGGASASQGLGTIAAVQDYAGAWTAERGRCPRLVHGSEDGRPTYCQLTAGEQASGSWSEYQVGIT